MDLLSLYRLLLRRRRVVIPTTLIVIGLLAATYSLVPPTYRASSSAVLLNPPTPASPKVGEAVDPKFQNPYVQFGDISIVVDIIRRVMTSEPIVQALQQQGLAGTFTVAANVNYARGPLIDIAAEAPTADQAIADVNLVFDEMGNQLQVLQAARGTDPQYFITSEIVVPPTRATTVFSSTLRRLIAVGALGVMFVIGSAILTDTIARRKPRRRPHRVEDSKKPIAEAEQIDPPFVRPRPKAQGARSRP